MPNQLPVDRAPPTRLPAAWQVKIALAAQTPWLASHLLRQSARIREQLLHHYQQLLALLSLACSRRRWRRFKHALPSLIAGGALLLAMNLGVPPAYAANFTVNDSTDAADHNPGDGICDTDGVDGAPYICTLRAAITEANAAGPGPHTLDLTTISGVITLGSDLPDITGSVQLNGPGPANLSLDGGGFRGIFGPAPGTDIGIDGLTISNVSGEGVYAGNDATVTNSVITGDFAGVYAGNNATVTDSTVTGDFAGVYAFYGDAEVTNSTVTGTYGDGVNAGNNATVTDSTVTGYYDGVYAYNGDAVVTNSTVTGDFAGVYAFYGDAVVTNSTVTGDFVGVAAYNNAVVVNSTVTGDFVGVGAYNNATVTDSTVTGYIFGVYAYNATVTGSTVTGIYGLYAYNATVTDSTVTGDFVGVASYNATITDSTVTGDYFGILAYNDATVTDSTVTGIYGDGVAAYNNVTVSNSTITGSGRYGVYSYAGGVVRVTNSTITGSGSEGIGNAGQNYLNNSIVAGNNGGGPDLSGTFAGANNLVGNGDGSGLGHEVNGNQVGTGGSPLDPRLGPLADNGGSTQTHALLPDSPAIDRADNGICAAAPINNQDQRGVARPTDGDGNGAATCDIGAYEAPAIVPPPAGGGDRDDDDGSAPTPTPASLSDQVFDCWPWEVIVPPLVVPNAGVWCQASLGAPLPAPGAFRYLDHSTDVLVKDAAGSPITQFNSPITVCFRYTQPELDAVGGDPADFLLQTFRQGDWENLPTTPAGDPSPTVLGRVCAPVDHLTLFALFARDGTAPAGPPADSPLSAVQYLPETGVRPVSLWQYVEGQWVMFGGITLAVTLGGSLWIIRRKHTIKNNKAGLKRR